MVAAVRPGEAWRSVAARFGVSVPTVTRSVCRAQGKRLDRTSCSDQSSAPWHVHNRTGPAMAKLVLDLRQPLRDQSDLGEFGAAAIRRELACRGIPHPPSRRTIGDILERHGALDYRRRIRRPTPPLDETLCRILSHVGTAPAILEHGDTVSCHPHEHPGDRYGPPYRSPMTTRSTRHSYCSRNPA
jgi:hypothetical protein